MAGLRQLLLHYCRVQSMQGDLVLMQLSPTLAPGCRAYRGTSSSSCCTVTALLPAPVPLCTPALIAVTVQQELELLPLHASQSCVGMTFDRGQDCVRTKAPKACVNPAVAAITEQQVLAVEGLTCLSLPCSQRPGLTASMLPPPYTPMTSRHT